MTHMHMFGPHTVYCLRIIMLVTSRKHDVVFRGRTPGHAVIVVYVVAT
jgi:hypothetical protein